MAFEACRINGETVRFNLKSRPENGMPNVGMRRLLPIDNYIGWLQSSKGKSMKRNGLVLVFRPSAISLTRSARMPLGQKAATSKKPLFKTESETLESQC